MSSTIYIADVYLHDDVFQNGRRVPDGWQDTGDNMRKAAQAMFDRFPDMADLVVTVNEHGGWHLCYHRTHGIVGSSNAQAIYHTDARRAFRERLRREPVEYLGTFHTDYDGALAPGRFPQTDD